MNCSIQNLQAEEAAQREAERLAEAEELREHRRNLQFKVFPP